MANGSIQVMTITHWSGESRIIERLRSRSAADNAAESNPTEGQVQGLFRLVESVSKLLRE